MKKILFALIFATILIMGCSGNNTQTSDSTPFIGGTSSIDVNFENDAPPVEVYAGKQYPFDIIVNIENSGEYDIKKEDFYVKLLGIEPTLFGITGLQKNPTDDLTGTKKDSLGNIITGVKTSVEFNNLNYQEDLDASINDLPIKAEACYTYGTKARTKVCIKKDVLDNKKSSVCTINEYKEIFNSGAPVQFTDMTETAQGTNKIVFSFNVMHNGAGYIYTKNSKCPNERGEENKVWIKIDAGLDGLSCSGITPDAGSTTSGFVNIGVDGVRNIRCTLDVTNAVTDFEKSISLEAIYDYKKDISTTLSIKPNLN